jgi:hypothetical protein
MLGEWIDGLLVGTTVIQIRVFLASFIVFMFLLLIRAISRYREGTDKTSIGGSAPSAPTPEANQ